MIDGGFYGLLALKASSICGQMGPAIVLEIRCAAAVRCGASTVVGLAHIITLIAGYRAERRETGCPGQADLSFPQSDVRSPGSYHKRVCVRLRRPSEHTNAAWRDRADP